MIVVMKPGASPAQIEHVFDKVKEMGYQVHPIYGEQRTVVACVGDERGKSRLQALEMIDGVESVVPILKPYKLAGTDWKREPTTITLKELKPGDPPLVIGAGSFVVMAGPCSVEGEEQIFRSAEQVKQAGARVLRGGQVAAQVGQVRPYPRDLAGGID